MLSLKRHLAERHFKKSYSRYQLRFLMQGAMDELPDDEQITVGMDLQLMLMSYLPPDEDRDLRFCRCCEEAPLNEVEESLKAFQNPNAKCNGSYCRSALCTAAIHRRVDIVSLLLEAGADPNLVGFDGAGPLHAACCLKCVEVVRLLLEHNAETNVADADGRYPLHWALMWSKLDASTRITRLLLKAGAERDPRNSLGATPLEVFMSSRKRKAVKIKIFKLLRNIHHLGWERSQRYVIRKGGRLPKRLFERLRRLRRESDYENL